MEGSLDDLVRYLLDDIALCGQQGATTEEVLGFLNEYCSKVCSVEDDADPGWKVDYTFQNQVWRWLVRHPDIKVGKDGKDNKAKQWSLAAVQAYNGQPDSNTHGRANTAAGRLPTSLGDRNESSNARESTSTALGSDLITSSKDGNYPTAPTCKSSSENGRDRSVMALESPHLKSNAAQAPRQASSNGKVVKRQESQIKLYACDNRLWWAAAGHGPNFEKIPPNYFSCLSIIASFREKGLPQPELVRLSGQDSRSVPRRTQELHDQGYIAKVPTFFQGHRTSQCILKRFAKCFSMEKNLETIMGAHQRKFEENDDTKVSQSTYLGMMQHRDRIEKMFELLHDNPIYGWIELKKKLGISSNWFQSRVLAVAVRRWESYGIVKRVRAVASHASPDSEPRQCVELIRSPEEKDWLLFYKFESQARPSRAAADNDNLDSDDDAEEEVPSTVINDTTTVNDGDQDASTIIADQAPPFWRPHQPFQQFLYDAISSGAAAGVSTMGLKDFALGSFFERPLEHTLTRLEDSWQMSQPLHLRYLAIVRDIASVSKVPHYVHFTFPNYKIKVENGDAEWEAVENVKPGKAQGEECVTAVANLDEFGFPVLDIRKFTGRQRCATLTQCVGADKRALYSLKGQDPIVIRKPNGKLDVSWSNNPYSKGRSHVSKAKKGAMDENGEPILLVETRGGRRIPKPKSYLHYFPSRCAHTRIILDSPSFQWSRSRANSRASTPVRTFVSSSGVSGWHDKDKIPPKRKGRPPKALKRQGKGLKPSIAVVGVGNEVDLGDRGTSEMASESAKRNADAAELGNGLGVSKRQRKDLDTGRVYLPSTYAHTRPLYHSCNDTCSERRAIVPTRKVPARKPRAKPQKPKESEVLTYQEQCSALERGQSGCFIGDKTKLRRPGVRGRNPDSRLAIFKSGRLGHFGWFLQNSPPAQVIKIKVSSNTPRRKLPRSNEERQIPPIPEQEQPQNIHQVTPSRIMPHETYTSNGQWQFSPQQGIASFANSAVRSPGESLAVMRQGYASPYGFHHSSHVPNSNNGDPTVTQAMHSSLAGHIPSAWTAVPVPQQSPYAPTPLYPAYPSPYAPTTAPCTAQGNDYMPFSYSTQSGAQYQMLQESGFTPVNQVIPRDLTNSLKRSYPLEDKEISAHEISNYVDSPATEVAKRRKVAHNAQGISADRRGQKPSAQSLVLTGLDPTRYRGVIQEVERSQLLGSVVELEHGIASLGERSALNDQRRSRVDSVGLTHDLAPKLGGTTNVLKHPTQSSVDNHTSTFHAGGSKRVGENLTSIARDMVVGPPTEPQCLSVELSSSQSRRQLSIPLDKNAPTQSSNDPLDLRSEPSQANPNDPKDYADSISSEQSFATARSRNQRSCSIGDSTEEHQLKTKKDQIGVSDGGKNEDIVVQIDQAIHSIPSPDARETIQTAQSDASSERVPSTTRDLHKVVTETAQHENATSRVSKISDREEVSNSANLVIAQAVSSCENVDDPNICPRQEQVEHGNEETLNDHDTVNITRRDFDDEDSDDLEIVDTIGTVPRNEEPKLRRAQRPFSNQQVITSGGSIGLLRRRIIMNILEEAGGLYPSGTELWFPFMAAWLTRGNASKPDNRTIRFAAKALIDSGKARQLIFTFKNKKGVILQKRILMLVEMSTSDPKILELKRQMIEKHPQSYFPSKPEISSALRQSLDGQRLLEQVVGDESFPTLQELERKRAEDKATKEQMEKNKKEKKAAWQHGAAERRKTYAKEWHAEKRFEKLGSKSVTPLTRSSKQSLKWQMLPRNLWSLGDDTSFTRNNGNSPHESELTRLRNTMSDAERYRMLDSMSPYNSIWRGSEDWNMPRKSTQSRKRKTAQAVVETLDTNDGQGAEFGSVTRKPINGRDKHTPALAAQQSKPKKPLIENMPQDLAELLSQYSPSSLPSLDSDMTDFGKFNTTVDRVVYWELDTDLAQAADCSTLAFINHEFTGPQESVASPYKGPHNFVNVSRDQKDVVTALARMRVPKALRAKFNVPTLPEPYQPEKIVPRKRRARKDATIPKRERQKLDKSLPTTASKVVRRLTILKNRVSKLKPIEIDPKIARSYGNLRLRTRPSLRYLSASEERRIVLTVVIVRTLTGGLERNIDWPLVTSIFKEKYTEIFIHRKWGYMMQKYREYLIKLQEDFQVMFAKAYEDDLVPQIDYEHLDQYDWDAVIEWSDKHIDAQYASPQLAEETANLPEDRLAMDNSYDLQTPPEFDKNAEYFELQGPATIPRRYTVAHAEPAAMVLGAYEVRREDKTDVTHKQGTADNLTIAKSWIKANIVTPVHAYSSEFASSKFSLLPDSSIQNGLKALFNSKQIIQETKTMYELADSYITRLNRNISISMLKDAAAAKMQLDESFQRGEKVYIQQMASDGHCMAILNLAMGRKVTINTKNPPMTKWGLLEKGTYETRRMNKKKMLFFDMEVEQTAAYTIGCPLPLPLPEPPLQPERRAIERIERVKVPAPQTVPESAVDVLAIGGESCPQNAVASIDPIVRVTYVKANQKEPIPLWYDINGTLVAELWETCISTVVSALILRPGIPMRVLCLALRDTLEQFEIEAIVQWLVDATAVQWRLLRDTELTGRFDENPSVEPMDGWWGVLWQRVEEERHTGSRNTNKEIGLTRNMDSEVGGTSEV